MEIDNEDLLEAIDEGKIRILEITNIELALYKIYLIECINEYLLAFKVSYDYDRENKKYTTIIEPLTLGEIVKSIVSNATVGSVLFHNYGALGFLENSTPKIYGHKVFKHMMTAIHEGKCSIYDFSKYLVPDTSNFFHRVYTGVYRLLKKDKKFPLDKVLDKSFEYEEKDDIKYDNKFYRFYSHRLAIYEDATFDTLPLEKLGTMDVDPKEFTFINSIMSKKEKEGEYLEFIIELYTKIKFAKYITYAHEYIIDILTNIGEKYQSYI